jgi:hypothetical protein
MLARGRRSMMPRQLFFEAAPTAAPPRLHLMQPRAFTVRRSLVVIVCPSEGASRRGQLNAFDAGPEGAQPHRMYERRLPAGLSSVDRVPNDLKDRSPDDRSKQTHHPPAPPPGESYRALLSDPGVQRTVRYGDFPGPLGAQLAHPERLRDTHYLNCYAQVYEANEAQRLSALAVAITGNPRRVADFFLLTPETARTLELIPLLTSRAHLPPHLQRARHIVWPSDRVVRLQVATDPTVDVASDPASPPKATSPQKGIPGRFLKPWDFRLGRDEVIYDMTVGATLAGWLTSFLGRLWRGLRGGKEVRRWHALLTGHGLEEQLWGVRPPKDGLSRPAIRSWARKTLESAGYDPETMLLEWEVFWRRKGLH